MVQTQANDPVSAVLQSLPVSVTIFSQAQLRAPWGVFSEPAAYGVFHVVLSGESYLSIAGEMVHLTAGDMVVLARGSAHEMGDAPERAKVDLHSLTPDEDGAIRCLRHGGTGSQTRLLCGRLHFDPSSALVVRSLMPELIRVNMQGGAFITWLGQTLKMIDQEVASGSAGSDIIVTKLADVIFTQMLRVYLNNPPTGDRGWLAAMLDSRLATAMALMHNQPEKKWDVSTLASKAGMSRSAFFSRFSDVLGESPAQYLLRWRMFQACRALESGQPTLCELAEQFGYRSGGAFSKAFKRTVGKTPSEYREARASALLT